MVVACIFLRVMKRTKKRNSSDRKRKPRTRLGFHKLVT